ncbi:BTAD domain-containing putative transcriptional regulator [Streptomyces sp. NPDC001404]|uniref:BTAD domain-containing putative transcriptional regulator n=1 Tax=Streptomyces sp. NPDC001404 TaxID=3364571 RepID=UPI0036CB183E
MRSSPARWSCGRASRWPGLHGPHARTLRARLQQARLSLLEARLGLAAELGDRPRLAAEAGALVLEFPAGERLRAVQMPALYRAGRQAEALGVHEDTRRYLGTAPGAELVALHQRILCSDPTLRLPEDSGCRPRTTPGSGGAFPSPVPGFTGRDEQLRDLTGMLTRKEASAVVVSATNGMAGVGKTTLAVYTAHGLGDDAFPDGRLYVDLRGADAEPLQPHHVLEGFLQELGVADENVPDDAEERVALYRTLPTDRRMHLLLDNAASCEQLRPLLPRAADCAVLVSSRAWLTGLAGARHLRLDIMPPEDALRLLRRAIGNRAVDAEPEAAVALVATCGHLPLALRIVASRLAAEPGRPLADLVRRLADERRRLDELRTGDTAVDAAFELSYATLTPEQASAFRLLAVPDVPDLALPSPAALLGLGADEAEELLESLVELNLLESHRLDRYQFHDLVRAFARTRGAREAPRHDDPRPRRPAGLLPGHRPQHRHGRALRRAGRAHAHRRRTGLPRDRLRHRPGGHRLDARGDRPATPGCCACAGTVRGAAQGRRRAAALPHPERVLLRGRVGQPDRRTPRRGGAVRTRGADRRDAPAARPQGQRDAGGWSAPDARPQPRLDEPLVRRADAVDAPGARAARRDAPGQGPVSPGWEQSPPW